MVIVHTTNTSVTANVNVFSANEASATYQWIDCATNLPISGETNQTYTATAVGDYAVVVTNGCPDTSSCYNVLVISVGDQVHSGITLSPNPAHDYLNIETGSISGYTLIQIFSVDGKLVLATTFVNEQNPRLDISELSKGLYFITMNMDNKISHVKIVKD